MDHLNSERIHGLGYSLGGAMALLGAGAVHSATRGQQYCKTHTRTDAEFCGDLLDWIFHSAQYLRYLWHDVTLPNTSDPFYNAPIINGDLVLVAPVSQGLDLKTLADLSSVTVFAIEGDSIARPEFQARPIVEALPQEIQSSYQTIQGHHFAFIAPFPKWLTDQEDIAVAKDPEGFDRMAFLKELNARILSVFLD